MSSTEIRMGGLRSRSTWRDATMILSTLLFVLSAQAEAQPPSSRATDARQAFATGKRHYKRGAPLAALHSFQRALALEHRASTLLMIARCYRRLDRPDLALSNYERHLAAWAAKQSAPSPHRAEVVRRLAEMRGIVGALRRAETLLAKGDTKGALERLIVSRRRSAWPRIEGAIARCYAALERPERAHAALRSALVQWRRFSDPDSLARRRALEQLAKTLERKTPAPRTLKLNLPMIALPQETPTARSRVWLALGIASGALAVGAEIAAWLAYRRGTDFYADQSQYSTFRNLTIAGHLGAAALAAMSAISLYLHWRRPKRPAVDIAIVPSVSGWNLRLGFCL